MYSDSSQMARSVALGLTILLVSCSCISAYRRPVSVGAVELQSGGADADRHARIATVSLPGVAMVIPGFSGNNCMRSGGVVTALYELVCSSALSDINFKILPWGLSRHDYALGGKYYRLAYANNKGMEAKMMEKNPLCTFERFWTYHIVPSTSNESSYPSDERSQEFYEAEAARTMLHANQLRLGTVVYYLSIPPSGFQPWAQGVGLALWALDQSDEHQEVRIVVEKPLGKDVPSYRKLMDIFGSSGVQANQFYLLDHYVGKQMVMSMPTLFGGSMELRDQIAKCKTRVRVVQTEARDLAGRDFEDIGGQVRDMVQSHLLQVVASFLGGLIVKTPCPACSDDELSAAKLAALQSLFVTEAKLAQYDGYMDDGDDKPRKTSTPTYAFLQMRSTLEGWRDTVFTIETAKNVATKEAYLEYGCDADDQTYKVEIQPGQSLTVPDAATLGAVRMVQPGLGKQPFLYVDPVENTYASDSRFAVPSAYAYCLEAAIRGNRKLFPTQEEVLKQWQIVEDVSDDDSHGNLTVMEAPEGRVLPRYPPLAELSEARAIATNIKANIT